MEQIIFNLVQECFKKRQLSLEVLELISFQIYKQAITYFNKKNTKILSKRNKILVIHPLYLHPSGAIYKELGQVISFKLKKISRTIVLQSKLFSLNKENKYLFIFVKTKTINDENLVNLIKYHHIDKSFYGENPYSALIPIQSFLEKLQ
jgi:hypothetical protein